MPGVRLATRDELWRAAREDLHTVRVAGVAGARAGAAMVHGSGVAELRLALFYLSPPIVSEPRSTEACLCSRRRRRPSVSERQKIAYSALVFGTPLSDVIRIVMSSGGRNEQTSLCIERELAELASLRMLLSPEESAASRPAMLAWSVVRAQSIAFEQRLGANRAHVYQRRDHERPRAIVGLGVALVLILSALADLTRGQIETTTRPSVAAAARSLAAAADEWLQYAIGRSSAAVCEIVAHEVRMLERGAAAAASPVLALALVGLPPADAIRAEVAALRHAMWPPVKQLESEAPTPTDAAAYHAAAAAVGVRAGLLHASGPRLSLETASSQGWRLRPCDGDVSSGGWSTSSGSAWSHEGSTLSGSSSTSSTLSSVAITLGHEEPNGPKGLVGKRSRWRCESPMSRLAIGSPCRIDMQHLPLS